MSARKMQFVLLRAGRSRLGILLTVFAVAAIAASLTIGSGAAAAGRGSYVLVYQQYKMVYPPGGFTADDFVYNPTTGKRTKVQQTKAWPSYCDDTFFSPKGDRAVSSCYSGYSGPGMTDLDGLYVLYPSKRSPLRLVKGGVGLYSPTLSPDGKTVVYSHDDTNGLVAEHLFRISASGGKPVQLTFGRFIDEDPIFTPDGRWILFNRRDYVDSPTSVYAIPAQGGDPHPIGIPAQVKLWLGQVSPDGSTILLMNGHTTQAEGFDEATATVTGTSPAQTILSNVHVGPGYYSPDGSQIGYGRQGATAKVFHAAIANADGSNQRVISNDPAGYSSYVVAWIPGSAAANWTR